MRWTMVRDINKMDYGLMEMNEKDYGLKEVSWNMIIEFDNVTKVELRLSDYVMMWYKPTTEQLLFLCLSCDFIYKPLELVFKSCLNQGIFPRE